MAEDSNYTNVLHNYIQYTLCHQLILLQFRPAPQTIHDNGYLVPTVTNLHI